MPAGNGITYDHKGLKEVAGEFVDTLPAGAVFDSTDFAKHLSTVPAKRCSRKPNRKKISNHTISWQNLSRSKAYFAKTLRQLSNVKNVTDMYLEDAFLPKTYLYKTLPDGDLECYMCSTKFTPRKGARSRVLLNTCTKKCANKFLEIQAGLE